MSYELKGVKNHVFENAQHYMNIGYAGYRVTSDFEPKRDHPVTGEIIEHLGVDMTGAYGWNALDWVVAPWSGKIVAIERNVTLSAGSGEGTQEERVKKIRELGIGSGNYVRLRHNDRVETRMIHLAYGTVTSKGVGDIVKKGERLGYMGMTGMATGAHLHFEVIVDGVHVDPIPYLLGEKNVVSDYDIEGGAYMGYIKLTKELKYGDKGEEVRLLQLRLCQLSAEIEAEMKSHSFKSDGTPDGGFGTGTQNTLKKVQKMAGLPETGKLDKQTMDFLNSDFITLYKKAKEVDVLSQTVTKLQSDFNNMKQQVDQVKDALGVLKNFA